MNEESVPKIPRGTHLRFLADSRCMEQGGLRCVLCAGPDSDFACERCGAPFHGDCHLTQAASAGERAIFRAAVTELNAHRPLEGEGEAVLLWGSPGPAEQAVDRLLLLCPGCRS